MTDAEVLFEQRGAVGLITLNRPKALNALTRDMCVAVKDRLDAWAEDDSVASVVIRGAGERAFCAGGDIRSLYESGRDRTPYASSFFRDEYRMNAAIKHHPKPYIALIHGIVMGGGVGISVHGRYRIASENTLFAMPETGIGLFPDVGGSYFLSRCPSGIGMYLALTGTRLKTPDILYAGIATHVIAAQDWPNFVERLEMGDVVQLPAEVADAVSGSTLHEHRDEIDRAFSGDSVEAILSVLDAENSEWCSDTANLIRTKSPTSLKVTFRQIREGAQKTFDDCMRMEYRLANHFMDGHDFYEGVRATIVDKDGKPNWQPAALSDVSESDVDSYFAPLNGKELTL